RDSLWAYAPVGRRDGNLLLIVPYEEVTAQAAAAEAAILERTRQHLQTETATLIVVTLVVFLISSLCSRAVIRPLADLSAAARKIAAGDLLARADIRTDDELGRLGRAFNDMIPQLADPMRMRESLALAMEVQQHLLPAGPPEIEGLDIAGRSIYCDETGGDYYDFLDLTEVSPHLLGVAVGDVTGHGIAAALLMATGRALLRSRADQPGTLADMMCDINRRLAADTDAARFMTLVYLLIDSQSRTLRWVCAGHDPPITYDPRLRSFGELKGGGIPLGIDAEWKYEEFSGQASPDGQVIVIGTDGIWEARNPAGDMFGKDALRRVIAENALRSAEEISLAITESLAAFCRTRAQEDDITLVVVKVLPQENG
ncbi:MAG: SpoIIE family protein phosphatase, partial [Deltaproteobacteria bacterium]|nr:SpoIIE family protein phosphatase [Deltaproteobacteria bacterium]